MSDLVNKMEDLSVAGGGKRDSAATTSAPEPQVDVSKLSDKDLIKFLTDQENRRQQERQRKRQEKASGDKEHKFWNTQPVPAIQDTFEGECGPLDPNTDIASIKSDPYNMPAGFEWCNINVHDEKEIEEMYVLLTENYVEDDDCVFRFDYSKDFLQWALSPPGYLQEWHVGVRNQKTGGLMGCITAIPARVSVQGAAMSMVEINFLCVHKKLRTKRLAPVLIKEITRRVNLRNIWQATYTAGVVLPKPISRCQYWHRSLNIKKLVEVRFSAIPPRETLAGMIKKLKVPEKPVHPLRKMVPADAHAVHRLLSEDLSKRKLYQLFSVEELEHMLVPRDRVVECYVLETNGIVTDFCSFYHLPSTVFKCDKHNHLSAVYSYYNVATTMSFNELMNDAPMYSYYNVATTMSFNELMNDALVMAKLGGVDVFNALDLGENKAMFEELQFGAGDGNLQYYVYNWNCPGIEPREVGLVLV